MNKLFLFLRKFFGGCHQFGHELEKVDEYDCEYFYEIKVQCKLCSYSDSFTGRKIPRVSKEEL